jgi:formylglycine-generating enzyme required for sulfatase activity
MNQFEVTMKEFDEVMGQAVRNDSRALGGVTWAEATNYCARLTAKTTHEALGFRVVLAPDL